MTHSLPDVCWSDIRSCWHWLNANKRSVFLVLDEFENFYKSGEEPAPSPDQSNVGSLLSELHYIGDQSTKRPIIVVLTGSSSCLQSLVFCKGSQDVLHEKGFYGCQTKSMSLNKTKFLPITLDPLQTVEDVEEAMNKLRLDRVHDWCCSQTDAGVAYCQSKGRARLLIEYMKGSVADFRVSADHDNSEFTPVLRILWFDLKSKLSVRDLSYLCAHKADEALRNHYYQLTIALSSFQSAGITVSLLFDAAEAGIIKFNDGVVQLMHVSHLLSCMLFFEECGVHDSLSIAEQVSLLHPHYASMDEVNEVLVMDSLVANGLNVGKLGKMTFRKASTAREDCYHGIVGNTSHGLQQRKVVNNTTMIELSETGNIHLGVMSVFRNKAASLRKEFSDELGAHLVAVFTLSNAKEPLSGKKFIVVRIQVKLGLSKSSVGDPIVKMRDSEELLAKSMGCCVDEIVFVRVLWTSHPTTSRENSEDFCVVINSDRMLNYWSERKSPVGSFVFLRMITWADFVDLALKIHGRR
eukprot:gene25872-31246_t